MKSKLFEQLLSENIDERRPSSEAKERIENAMVALSDAGRIVTDWVRKTGDQKGKQYVSMIRDCYMNATELRSRWDEFLGG